MKVYLDMCAIQRLLDTPSQVRIQLEATAVSIIVSLCKTGNIDLVTSAALVYKNERNPLPIRQKLGYSVLAQAKTMISMTSEVKARAGQFLSYGVKPLDALHLALAEAGEVDYLCTCDDRLLKQAKRIQNLAIKVVSPLELVKEMIEP